MVSSAYSANSTVSPLPFADRKTASAGVHRTATAGGICTRSLSVLLPARRMGYVGSDRDGLAQWCDFRWPSLATPVADHNAKFICLREATQASRRVPCGNTSSPGGMLPLDPLGNTKRGAL